jgi:hypothetical protein
MARPVQPIVPTDPLIVVDGRSTAVLRSPVMYDARGRPLLGRSCTLALMSAESLTASIHNTLAGTGVPLGDGAFTLTIPPRALWLRLAPHANRRVWLCCVVGGEPAVYVPHLVAWRAAEFPVDAVLGVTP